jgi:integrase
MNMLSSPLSASDPFLAAIQSLPPLPRVIQYEDDYDEKIRSIKVDESADGIKIHVSGSAANLNLTRFSARIRPLMRSLLLSSLQTKAPHSVVNLFATTAPLPAEVIEGLALAEPLAARREWAAATALFSSDACNALKAMLAFLCQVRFGHWTPLHASFVSRAFPVRGRDPYSTVRSGESFIAIGEEARLVRWIDAQALAASSLTKHEAELASLVICSYQFGMRPKQLGMIRKRDCSIRISEEDGSAIVTLAFRMIKQRDVELAKLPINCKVKREWAQLLVALTAHKAQDDDNSFLFGFRSRSSLSVALIATLDEILPDEGRAAYDLRHSMAQRLVDSGASHEELAAALGHSNLRSALVYFRGSANQAELVNKALGVSETYRTVARIATEKFIDADELAGLRGDQQIGGVPHGIPISGIGGCKTGQPSCQYNPVTACYGCPKFMPVRDLALHEQVLKDFRSVVLLYKGTGHGETSSPAYLQLQRTISEVQGVILKLKGAND